MHLHSSDTMALIQVRINVQDVSVQRYVFHRLGWNDDGTQTHL